MDTLNKPIKTLQWNICGLRNHLPFLKDSSLYRDQIDIAIQETIYEGTNIKVTELHHRVNITKKNLLKFPSKDNLELYRDTLRHVKRELWDIQTKMACLV